MFKFLEQILSYIYIYKKTDLHELNPLINIFFLQIKTFKLSNYYHIKRVMFIMSILETSFAVGIKRGKLCAYSATLCLNHHNFLQDTGKHFSFIYIHLTFI